MKLNITIIEDEFIYVKQLQQLLKSWSIENHILISVRHFPYGEDFYNKEYDEDEIFFLDIELKTMNGMSIARQLRKDGFHGTIIFLTSFSEYVFDGYHVQALDYLLKPIDYQKLDTCLRPIINNLNGAYHTYQTKTEIVKIPYNKILCFSAFRHYVDIMTQIPVSSNDKNTFTFSKLMDSIAFAPIKTLYSILNFEILGVNVFDFLTALLTLGLALMILKIFL